MMDTTAWIWARDSSLPAQPEQKLLGTGHCCRCDGFLFSFLECMLDTSIRSPSKKNQRGRSKRHNILLILVGILFV